MVYCLQCGVKFEGRFCSGCGRPSEEAQAVNLHATLCYLFGAISGVVFLLLPPFNADRAIRFHALQSIFGTVALLGAYSVVALVLPWFLPLVGLAALVLWMYILLKTHQGRKIVLPFIGPLAEQTGSNF